ncbi:hypothetical protein ACHAP7_012229 [Fusarium lateritium]
MNDSLRDRLEAPYIRRHTDAAIVAGNIQLVNHEIRHYLRSHVENCHRMQIGLGAQVPLLMDDLSQLDGNEALNFRNKTIAIYPLRGDAQDLGLMGLLPMVLGNYLYRRWFKPYRSEIDRGQFIGKVMKLVQQPYTSDYESAVALAIKMHNTLNARLDTIKHYPFYITRPLFRAIVMVIPGQSFRNCITIARLATMRVLLVLTGEQKGLSSPIDFSPIADKAKHMTLQGLNAVETDLETSVGFIMFLEQREEVALGPQPDPFADAASEGALEELVSYSQEDLEERLGWKGEPLTGPSSVWVDTNIYWDWTGDGASADAVLRRVNEERVWKQHARYCSLSCDQEPDAATVPLPRL